MGLLSTFGAASGRAFGLTRVGAAIKDAYFNLTTLLLPGNGTNGAQNNTFLDSGTANSGSGFTITRNGQTTQGTFSPFSQTGWSNYFDGTSDYLSLTGGVTDNGTGDITFEFWSYYTGSYSAEAVAFDSRVSPFTNGFAITVAATSGYWTMNFASQDILTSTAAAKNAWQHVALTRSGNTFRLFVDGVLRGTLTSSNNLSNNTNKIGASYNNGSAWPGYISNLRAIKGSIPTAYQTSSTTLGTSVFTPPTAPLTAVSGTSLLTCQANRFLDASTNAFTITPSGDVSVQAFSPFAPTAAYSAATNGGSGYFDGNGDYLTVPSSSSWLFNGDACLEAWVYRAADTDGVIFATGGASSSDQFAIFVSEGLWWGLTSQTGLPKPKINTWAHCVVTRSGSTIRRFIDGVLVSTGTNSSAIGTSSGTAYIGSRSGSSVYFNGYMSGLRVINGSIPTSYQTSSTTTNTQIFTPPTAPPTTTSEGATSGDVKLLLNYTNAGITDATAKNDLETVGNAQISTTQSKFGGSSMYFDGTGDWLTLPASQSLVLGTADFTLEAWIYTTSSATQRIFSFGTGNNCETLLVNTGSNVYLNFYNGTTDYGSTSYVVSQNQWVHIAVTRSSNNLRLFINGTLQNTPTSITNNYTANTLIIGKYGAGTPDAAFVGYMDDVRITRGYARYTANFSVPTSAFPVQ